MTECQICLESFSSDQIDKVSCGSSVDHNICFDCEKNWRSKMPLQDGVRIMNCPTCRQPEKYQTVESLKRQASIVSPVARAAVRHYTREEVDDINARLMAPPLESLDPFERQLAAITALLMQTPIQAPTGTRDAPVVLDARPPRARCASGRNCRSTSQTGRSMTHLKCTRCNVVFCCRTCKVCVGCIPVTV